MSVLNECGWTAYGVVALSLLSLFVALVSLVLAVAKPPIGGVMSLLALALALAPGGLGVIGTIWGRSRVDEAVSGASISSETRERIRSLGYAEAATCTPIGLYASAPPLVLSGIALVIALARRKRAASS
jgi:hypothetical protein